jgi:hypothetical protein
VGAAKGEAGAEFTFDLTGAAVPEPTLMGQFVTLAVLGLVGMRARRRPGRMLQ